MTFKDLCVKYLECSSLHGAKFIVDKHNNVFERIFWAVCVLMSWAASAMLMSAAYDAYENNAITFVAETSYNDWDTHFPSIVVCETKNMDRVQEIAEQLWGKDHDFTLEEVLNEITYFRGESYHTIHECFKNSDNEQCITANFTHFAKLVRSNCSATLLNCQWNEKSFDCCHYFHPMETELGICYALNSNQVQNQNLPKFSMVSNKYTGPGKLKMDVLTESNIYTLGEEEVPNLVTAKSDYLTVGPYISYVRMISVKNIENDALTRSVSVSQRSCRFTDENTLNVHRQYSYSACSVQCRKDKQMTVCNCTSHLMPNTPIEQHCNMDGLRCLNDNYEDLSVVIASWSHDRKGLVCDCLPSCTEIDVSVVHDSRNSISGHQLTMANVVIGLVGLPTERYKRNVVRGILDLFVSMGGATGLFIGASVLSFVEFLYHFTLRPYLTYYSGLKKFKLHAPTTVLKH